MPNHAKRAAELRQQLEHHNHLYYVEAKPEISDREFDTLLSELQEIEKSHPELATPDSPTQRVGGKPIAGFVTVQHRVPMLSIDNTYNAAELRDFDKRLRKLLPGEAITYVVELKIDGVAISLTYEDGLFTVGATRGDGASGDDVSHNLKTIHALPLKLSSKKPPALFEARGEVYMTRADLVSLNQERVKQKLEPLANPRNTTAGSLKLLDPVQCGQRRLRLFVYALGAVEGVEIHTQLEMFELLKKYGFPVNPNIASCDSIDSVIAHCDAWADRRSELPYDTDGMVIKVNDFEQRRRLGATNKAPRWVVAYKYAAEQALTRLLDIEIQVGKTGALTPVAHLDPVQLGGTTVSRASLHNADEITRKDIRVGDMIVVEKAGEIIPYIVRSEHSLRTGTEQVFRFPDVCPVCSAPVKRDPNASAYRCTGTDCMARVKRLICSFARRKCMDIEGLGTECVDQLVDTGLVRSIPDLYRLRMESLLDLERMGKKSAQNLLDGITASKDRGLMRVLTGLAIPHVGEHSAELLADEFLTIDALMEASAERLSTIDGIGSVLAESVVDYFHSETGRTTIEALRELGVRLEEQAKTKTVSGNSLAGKSFVVTGTLVAYGREEIEDLIKRLGGKPTGSVSKKTDYLIAGEKAGSKLTKAQELGVKILSEDEFARLIASSNAT